jgi:hypothetical protein
MTNAAQFFNQHSYLITGAAILLILAIFSLVRRARWAWLVWLVVAVALGAGWLALRTEPGAQFSSVEAIEATVASGQPTLVEFYSDY